MKLIVARKWVRRNWWKFGVLTMVGWTGFYTAAIAPMQYTRTVSEQRASALGAVAGNVGWDPISMWRQPLWRSGLQARRAPMLQRGTILAKGQFQNVMLSSADSSANTAIDRADVAERKIVRNAALEVVAKSPSDCGEKIRTLAERLGGYMVSSEISSNQAEPGGAITIRVPAASFEEARLEIRKMAVRVDNEKAEASDVTKEYVDREARLRNLHALEGQYLAIMKRSVTVHEALEVSAKLSEVRGQIEQQQAEFVALSRQVETVAITVSLRAEADAQVFGLYWRPLYQFKVAAREGLESLASYATAMTAAIFRLPAILLWIATMVLCAAVGWRMLRWSWRKFFADPQAILPAEESS